MLKSTTDSLVNKLQTEVGNDLRIVGKYDTEDLDLLYIRDDVESTRPPSVYDQLHERTLLDHQDRTSLESDLQAGRFRASLLVFEDVLGANLLGQNQNGHVVTMEQDVELNLQRFLRRFDVVSATVRKFQAIRFEHTPGGVNCSRCGSVRTISTPEAGPSAPYHCLSCDSSFT
jgi:hypothetical protein